MKNYLIVILAVFSTSTFAENYYISVASGSTSATSTVDGKRSNTSSAEIGFGQYVKPDISVEISYMELGNTSTSKGNTDGSRSEFSHENIASKVVLSKYFQLSNMYKISAHGGGMIVVENTSQVNFDDVGNIVGKSEYSSRSNKIYLGLGLSYQFQSALISVKHEIYKTDLQDFKTTLLGVQFSL